MQHQATVLRADMGSIDLPHYLMESRAVITQYTFGRSRGTRGIDDERRIFRSQGWRWIFQRKGFREIVHIDYDLLSCRKLLNERVVIVIGDDCFRLRIAENVAQPFNRK